MLIRSLAAAVAFVLLGNLAILSLFAWAHGTAPTPSRSMAGVDNFRMVDDHLWRGGAPSTEGYQALAAAGAETVVDLRAEKGLEDDISAAADSGMKLVRIPIRDGQAPSEQNVEAFLQATRDAEGPVFVHCGAGVGRTGTMTGAYLVEGGKVDGLTALRRNLAVGPPSLEQIAFVAGMDRDRVGGGSNPVPTAVSRVLDAPRRLWTQLR